MTGPRWEQVAELPGGVRVARIVVGALAENCYVLAPASGGDAIVIDPGDDADEILAGLRDAGLRPRLVVNTHGHMDHIGGNAALIEEAGGALLIHAADAAMLTDPARNLSSFLPPPFVSPPATRTIEGGEELAAGALRLRVLHTPGHTPGGVCLVAGEGAGTLVFSGDTLFAGSVGRVDLPGGSWEQQMQSIEQQLLPLPPAAHVFPGHGPATDMATEHAQNPFVREWLAGRPA